MELLIWSSMCTLIFFCDRVVPATFTNLRLNALPDSSRKKTRNTHMVACPMKVATPLDPQSRNSLRPPSDFATTT
ncbi:hypothetical protein D3C85_1262620 [compost metagenome]